VDAGTGAGAEAGGLLGEAAARAELASLRAAAAEAEAAADRRLRGLRQEHERLAGE
jgi:hypothetical protein